MAPAPLPRSSHQSPDRDHKTESRLPARCRGRSSCCNGRGEFKRTFEERYKSQPASPVRANFSSKANAWLTQRSAAARSAKRVAGSCRRSHQSGGGKISEVVSAFLFHRRRISDNAHKAQLRMTSVDAIPIKTKPLQCGWSKRSQQQVRTERSSSSSRASRGSFQVKRVDGLVLCQRLIPVRRKRFERIA